MSQWEKANFYTVFFSWDTLHILKLASDISKIGFSLFFLLDLRRSSIYIHNYMYSLTTPLLLPYMRDHSAYLHLTAPAEGFTYSDCCISKYSLRHKLMQW